MGQVDIYSSIIGFDRTGRLWLERYGAEYFRPVSSGCRGYLEFDDCRDTTGICPEAIERMKQSWRISDLMIRGDYFRSDF